MEVRRGDILLVDLFGRVGSEQEGLRPAVVLQNNAGNINSNTTIVAPISSKTHKKPLPTHVGITLDKESLVLLEHIVTIDKCRIKDVVGKVDNTLMKDIDKSVKISLGLH